MRTIRAKNITGEDIKRIIDVFMPLISGLEKKSEGEKRSSGNEKDKDYRNPYSSERRNEQRRLPPGWKEVVSPAGNTIFVNTFFTSR